jgi:hypothetical protein
MAVPGPASKQVPVLFPDLAAAPSGRGCRLDFVKIVASKEELEFTLLNLSQRESQSPCPSLSEESS